MPPAAISPTILTSDGSTLPLYPTAQNSNLPSSSLAVQAPSPNYHGYHHVTWWVGNAKQAASYYSTRMGFRTVAYAGLETGSRSIASHVVQNGSVCFVFHSPIRAGRPARLVANGAAASADEVELVREMHAHLEQHGDAVKDVAFEVDDVWAVYTRAVEKGAVGVAAPRVLRDEVDGDVMTASVRTYGDTTHTFIEKMGYTGVFLPGFKTVEKVDALSIGLPECPLQVIDHCVGNQDWNQMEEACDL